MNFARRERTVLVLVKIPADLSFAGCERWKVAQIDEPIAGLVGALQLGGVNMRASCSGHGALPGNIALQDGRVLVVFDRSYIVHPIRSLLRGAWQHASWWLRRWWGAGWPGQYPPRKAEGGRA